MGLEGDEDENGMEDERRSVIREGAEECGRSRPAGRERWLR
jgi:hypothetical protein